MLKLYYFLLSKKIHFLKYCRYHFDVMKFLLEGRSLRERDEGNTNKRLRTFRKYMTEENKTRFLNKLDNKGKNIGKKLIKKIENIMYSNILPYGNIFDAEEKKQQESFANFCIENKDIIPFDINEV